MNEHSQPVAVSTVVAGANGMAFPVLTKRELFAAMAMQGLVGNANLREDVLIASKSVQLADELLKELAK